MEREKKKGKGDFWTKKKRREGEASTPEKSHPSPNLWTNVATWEGGEKRHRKEKKKGDIFFTISL